jgi:uncharacterized protein YneF (UPF0154 family)
MEWIAAISAAVSVLGTGGIGGFFLANRKINKEAERAEKLNEARIKEVQATTSLEIERGRSLFFDRLQENNDKANKRIDELTEKVAAQGRRIHELESILIQHNIPIPE